jgi:hypothetical protein
VREDLSGCVSGDLIIDAAGTNREAFVTGLARRIRGYYLRDITRPRALNRDSGPQKGLSMRGETIRRGLPEGRPGARSHHSDRTRRDLDAIHRMLAGTHWSPGIRREVPTDRWMERQGPKEGWQQPQRDGSA